MNLERLRLRRDGVAVQQFESENEETRFFDRPRGSILETKSKSFLVVTTSGRNKVKMIWKFRILQVRGVTEKYFQDFSQGRLGMYAPIIDAYAMSPCISEENNRDLLLS